MDEKGRINPEGNSVMLWDKEWNELRGALFKILSSLPSETKIAKGMIERYIGTLPPAYENLTGWVALHDCIKWLDKAD